MSEKLCDCLIFFKKVRSLNKKQKEVFYETKGKYKK